MDAVPPDHLARQPIASALRQAGSGAMADAVCRRSGGPDVVWVMDFRSARSTGVRSGSRRSSIAAREKRSRSIREPTSAPFRWRDSGRGGAPASGVPEGLAVPTLAEGREGARDRRHPDSDDRADAAQGGSTPRKFRPGRHGSRARVGGGPL